MSSKEEVRKEVISMFYTELLGRDPDEAGLNSYLFADADLESVYYALYNSEEAKTRRAWLDKKAIEKQGTLPLSLAVFCKDNEDCIVGCINSVKKVVRDIVVLDTGSSDNTVKLCEDLGVRVFKCGFTNFGDIRTLCAGLAKERWVLGLDSDERILEEDIPKLIRCIEKAEEDCIEIIGFPRKRWLDLEMSEQLEEDVYPDLQYRLFRNKPEIKYIKRVHEVISGSEKRTEYYDGPVIQHFQDSFKSGKRLVHRNKLYKELQKIDLDQGVEHNKKAVQDIDEV